MRPSPGAPLTLVPIDRTLALSLAKEAKSRLTLA